MYMYNLREELTTGQIGKVLTPEIRKLGNLFTQNGFELRIVGGAVRDLLLGKTPKDIDFATDAQPNEMIAFLEAAGWHTIPTGLEHGTISVLGSLDEPYEITTLRIDVETFGRQATVEFTTDFKQDAERRDLTFNAMSIDMNGKIYDYFNGIDDLRNNRARFVGEPDKRIREDYLRILRFFRFQGRMGQASVDPATLNALSKNAKGLQQISGERIWAEFQKILMGNSVEDLVRIMCSSGVAAHANIPCKTSGLSTIQTTNPLTKLAYLTANEDEAESVIARWKMSNEEKGLYTFLVKYKDHHIDLILAKKMVTNKVPKEYLFEYFNLQKDRISANMILDWEMPMFPVSGKDLIGMGMKPGPEMGQALAKMKARWQDSGFELTRDDLVGN